MRSVVGCRSIMHMTKTQSTSNHTLADRVVLLAVTEASQDGGSVSVQDIHARTGIHSSTIVGSLIYLQRADRVQLRDDDDRTNRWHVASLLSA